MNENIINGTIIAIIILTAIVSAYNLINLKTLSKKKIVSSISQNYNSEKNLFSNSIVKLNLCDNEMSDDDVKKMQTMGEKYRFHANGSIRMANNYINSVESMLAKENDIIFP